MLGVVKFKGHFMVEEMVENILTKTYIMIGSLVNSH